MNTEHSLQIGSPTMAQLSPKHLLFSWSFDHTTEKHKSLYTTMHKEACHYLLTPALKFTEPLQRYLLTCHANSSFLARFFCTGQQQLWRGSVNFKIKISRPIFTIIFKPKMSISWLEILVHLLKEFYVFWIYKELQNNETGKIYWKRLIFTVWKL